MMDRIYFKAKDYFDVLGDNMVLFDQIKDYNDTEPQDGDSFVVVNYRIVVPKLGVSFREADWCTLDEEAEPDNPKAWKAQASVYLRYEENEKDINQWICSCTDTLDYSLLDVCLEKKYPTEEIGELECYIEFDE